MEIFAIKKQRWVEYWLRQPHPVMLVIGTFSEDDERAIGKDKLEIRRGALDGNIERAPARKRERDEAGEADRVQRRTARPEQRAAVAGEGAEHEASRMTHGTPQEIHGGGNHND